MTAKHPQFFAFYPLVFSGDNKVAAMGHTALGAYILLLCAAWQEDPPGTLPDDDGMLCRYARMPSEQWIQVKSEVVAAFRFANGRWVQKRLVEEYKKAVRTMKVRSAAGLAGANARHGKGMANAEQSHAQRVANTIYSLSPSSDGSSSEGSLRETAPVDPPPGAALCTPRFLEAWVSYRNHRRQLGDRPLTQAAETAALAKLTGWGIDRAVAALEHTVAMGWKNIREPERDNGHSGGNSKAAGGTSGMARHIEAQRERDSRMCGVKPKFPGE